MFVFMEKYEYYMDTLLSGGMTLALEKVLNGSVEL